MTKPNSTEPKVQAIAPVLLVTVAFAESLLSLYQWMELVLVRSGGKAICALTATVNCATVWNSAFASRVHELLGVPIAALGLVWGLTAFGLSLMLAHRMLTGGITRGLVAALQITAAAGALSCVTFAVGSYNAGALCLTCLTTFAVVFTFTFLAFKYLPGTFPPASDQLKPALKWAGGFAVVGFLAVLYPGLQTPSAKAGELKVEGEHPAATSDGPRLAAEYLAQLPAIEQQAISDTLAAYKRAPAPDVSGFAPRNRLGAPTAPMKVVDFTDVRCGHCRALVETMKKLEEVLPPGLLSVEARQFPLDGECNRSITRSDGSGVSCLAAKAQICLEGAPDFWALREKLFAAQDSLTKELILTIASSGSMSREKLAACVANPETQTKLDQDVSFAMLFNPEGTPVVLVNGREGAPSGAWLYVMALAGADPSSKAFAALPAPR
jgi:serine/threonine-protein kinase